MEGMLGTKYLKNLCWNKTNIFNSMYLLIDLKDFLYMILDKGVC